MSEENIIKTIEIEIEGQTIRVTPEGLLKFHKAAEELLNLKTEKITEREIIRETYVPYSHPTWYWTYPNYIYNPTLGTTITTGGTETIKLHGSAIGGAGSFSSTDTTNLSNINAITYTASNQTAKLSI